jgi:hypothetical protein
VQRPAGVQQSSERGGRLAVPRFGRHERSVEPRGVDEGAQRP